MFIFVYLCISTYIYVYLCISTYIYVYLRIARPRASCAMLLLPTAHAAHCGMHALNNSLGAPLLTPQTMRTAAATYLRQLEGIDDAADEHIRAGGWYPIQVLYTALFDQGYVPGLSQSGAKYGKGTWGSRLDPEFGKSALGCIPLGRRRQDLPPRFHAAGAGAGVLGFSSQARNLCRRATSRPLIYGGVSVGDILKRKRFQHKIIQHKKCFILSQEAL